MSSKAWKATLQNGYRVEFDYYDDVDTIEMFVSPTKEEDTWFQQIPETEDRTPESYDGNRIWVATLADGDQILVEYWQPSGLNLKEIVMVAYRGDRWASWWAPVTAEPITINAGDMDDI